MLQYSRLTINQFNNSNMSDHLEMSGESSLDKNFQIRTNNEGQNELYIPCWEEEGSNSTQYHHLIEETKFFKNKCKHLENHLEENHREFSSLNQLYLIAETNERRLLKENEDLRKTNRELIGELSSAKVTIDTTSAELHAVSKRESDFRQKFFKSRDRQTELLAEVENLRSQCEMLKRKSAQGHSGAEDQKWKRYHNEQANQIQQWKAAYEALELQFDKKSKEIREKNQEIKSLNKAFNSHKEDYQLKIKGLQGDLEEIRRQLLKSKATINDYQRQIKDIRLVRDQVSAKNDQIQAQNSRLKRSLKDQASKYQKLLIEHQQFQHINEELKDKNSALTTDLTNLKNTISEMKLRLSNLEKQLNESRSQKEKIIVSKNQAENAYANLQEYLSQYKRQKENELSNLKSLYDGKIKELKESSMNQKQTLEASISTLQKEIQFLKSQRRDNTKLEASANRINQLEEENSALKQQVLNWKTKFDRLNSKYREQLLSFPKEQYETQINDLKLEVSSWKGKFDKLNTRYQEHLSSSKDVQECRHDDEINDIKQELKRTIDQNEQLKINSAKSEKFIDNLNAQLDALRNKNENLSQEIQKIEKINKLYQEERERLIKERNKLALDIQYLQNERQKNQTQFESKAYQTKLKQQKRQIERLIRANQELEHQIQTYRSRQEIKDAEKAEKDKNKKYEIKLRQKERQISELEKRIEQIENQHEKQRGKYKIIQKQNRIKENQLNKKEWKLKDLEKNIAQIMIQIEQLDVANQRGKIQIETLKKQLKIQQSNNQKLKTHIQRHNSQKQNWESQQASNRQRIHEKQRHQWQEQEKKFISQIKDKEEEITELKKQIQLTLKGKELLKSQASNLDAEKQKNFKQKIAELEQLLKEKESLLKRYQSVQRKDDDIPTGTLEQLQAEYNRQLLALKRLIMYKGYKEDQNRRLQQLKTEYQSKIQIIMTDYKAMYQQLMILKQKLLNQKAIAAPEPYIDVGAIQEIWRIKVQQISQERQVLIQKVAMWQRKYEQLRFLFEAKLESKQETINLLNLKLSNLEIARPLCQYSCHHR